MVEFNKDRLHSFFISFLTIWVVSFIVFVWLIIHISGIFVNGITWEDVVFPILILFWFYRQSKKVYAFILDFKNKEIETKEGVIKGVRYARNDWYSRNSYHIKSEGKDFYLYSPLLKNLETKSYPFVDERPRRFYYSKHSKVLFHTELVGNEVEE